MTLIKSISGIRGTIGGKIGEGLSPLDVVKFSAAYGHIVTERTGIKKIVVGRDARLSGPMILRLVVSTLQALGIEVVDLGLSTTPTVELAVPMEKAAGGIILTASHNPAQWNALKLLNDTGEFISDADGKAVLALAEEMDFDFADIHGLGTWVEDNSYLQKHIDEVLDLDTVDAAAIAAADFSIVVDAVNSSGGIFVPALLEALGVNVIHKIHCEPTGNFQHNPEPLAENLTDLAKAVVEQGASLGIAVDPDVDRLCFMMENGELFGEEYTLVAVADYVLEQTGGGNTVSNLSSTRALRDVTEKHGGQYFAAAVGEVNVVAKMKEVNAVIGGEGNGGVIYPATHYGRDALAGIGVFLTLLAKRGVSISELKKTYPAYFMSKNKINLTPTLDIDGLLSKMEEKYVHVPHSNIDGLKIDFKDSWVHLRKSNTEPIIRVYTEATSQEKADDLAERIILEIRAIID
ncbi:phosphoglucosamine mutase [Olivibacter sitiensis]|uniref:phosphoglucosamine mutase n=1 Tax=Olivibacter sitiensis TaxID=376470 RepID=UPI000405014F|nr:phosphoglucosamine mutase [Olivibacter sitiensis]